MRKLILLFTLFLCSICAAAEIDSKQLQALKYRNIGPSRGGRCAAVSGVIGEPNTFYQGTAGGVWKSVNAGQSWENISDKFFESGSIGAIAVADSNPSIIYVGTGQSTIRGNVATGVGMYKSVDAGKTWKHIGLRKVGQIGRIRIHPTNPNLVYVAVIGNPWVPNEERGLYRSKDGGENWEKIFYISPKTGFADLAMDLNNPKVLYASAWTAQRKPWTIISGSEESGLYKTNDGGDKWEKLKGGLPQGVVGKIGVAVSPANSERIWALVEAKDGGLFRSDNAGETWTLLKTNQKRRLYQRPWYYMHIFADPKDAQKVYILNVDEFRSRDGGNTFEVIDVPHGDGHDLWINPSDTRMMVFGSDGGAAVTMDEGKNWSTLLNQPTAEMYYVTVDNQFPYRVYGAQQDNSTISIASRNTSGKATPYEDWRELGGGESGHIGFAFSNPDIVYAGSYGGEITRLNVKTGELKNVMAYPQMEIGLAARDLRYRFNWNGPLRVSMHNPNELYFASQYVHRSTDEGHSWQVISPDLSRNDISKQDYAGEPITYENTGIEVYGNVLSFEESPVKAGVFWAGSDDGLVHVTDDNGKTWRNVTPSAMPEWGSVNTIEASPHDAARAFISVLKYKLGDYHPYVFRTDDFGKSWTLLTSGSNGISSDNPARVVREDPARKSLLYAGTENGMYVSFDDGQNWKSLQLNLPIVPVTDLEIHDNDLVASTQGRSFWILDDLTVVHQVASSTTAKTASLLQPRNTYRMRMPKSDSNPPNGALIFYSLPEEVKGEITLQIYDSKGNVIQTFSSEYASKPDLEFPYDIMGTYAGDRKLTKNAGLNRFVWDLRYPVIDFAPGTIVWGYLGGVKVAPGTFKATLNIGDWNQSQTFTVLKDPRSSASQQDLDEQFAFEMQIQDRLNELYRAVKQIRSVRQQAHDLTGKVATSGKDDSGLKKASDSLWQKLTEIEDELMQPRNEADQDTENYPTKIDNQLAYIYMHLDYSDSRPTEGQKERVNDLFKEIDVQLAKLKSVLQTDVAAFNKLAVAAGVTPVSVGK
jgi:photosystem II stability/assembly factor-like uncharacterized protein